MFSLSFEQNNSYLTNMQKEYNPTVLQEMFLSFFRICTIYSLLLYYYYLTQVIQLIINKSLFNCWNWYLVSLFFFKA